MQNSKAKKLNFKFLVDRPLKEDDELELINFGHRELGHTLTDIVVKCEAPFTIGLHGKWGTGKSTLAYFLRKSLKSKNIPVVIFDVWKHEKDQTLRRTFLKELAAQLKDEYGKSATGKDIFKSGDEKFKVDDRLDSSISKKSEGKLVINWEKLKQAKAILFWFVLVGFVLAAIPAWILKNWNVLWNILGWEISIIFGGTFLTWLLKISSTFFATETTTIGLDRFQDPIEFEGEFQRILRSTNDDYKRLLIIFDNIDRVSSDKAIGILSTIKTFLEPSDELVKEKEVVFLVPCDAQALREHIKSVYVKNHSSSYDPDEFLRKFFNATIWIPDFIPTELDQYTHKKLKETAVPHLNNELISALITIAFRENPRQIIQFINVLLSNYLLILERTGENKDFEPEFLDKNTEKLCRFLLLQQLYPEIIRKIKSEHVTNIDILTSAELGIENEKAKQFLDIKDRTQNLAPLENVRIFYTLRLSNEEKQFPGIENFYIALEDEKIEEAQKFLQNIKEYSEKKTDLSRLVKDHLEKITNPVIKARFINSLLTVFYKEVKNLEYSANISIYTATDHLGLPQLIFIQPDLFTQMILKDEKSWRKKIFDKWISLISLGKDGTIKLTDDFLEKILKVFISNIEFLNNEPIEGIKKALAQPMFYKSWAGELLTSTISIQNKLLSTDFVYGFITSLNEESPEKISIVVKFKDDLFHADSKQELVIRITNILDTSKDIKDKLENLLIQLNKLVKDKKEVFSDVKDQSTWDKLWAVLNQTNSKMDWNGRRIIMPLFFSLWGIVPKPTKNQLQPEITGFIQNANLESIKYFMQQIEYQNFLKENTFFTPLEQKAIQNQEFFDYLYDELIETVENKYNILIKLIDHDLSRALTKIKKKYANLPQEENLIAYILNKFDSADKQAKSDIIEICNLTKCANNKEVKDNFANKIKSQLTQTDKQQQIVVLDKSDKLAYLGNEILRKLTTGIFDWIKQQGSSGQYHILPIKFIYDLNQFTTEEKEESIYYIFQILRKSNDQSELEVACDLLLKLKPTFEDHQQEFNDFKNRIEGDGNATIKRLLIGKFFELKENSKINKKNKDFWEFIEILHKDYEKDESH